MNPQQVKTDADWVAGFAQQSASALESAVPIHEWGRLLAECLRQEKPDNEFYIIAFSRVPRIPALLLGSSAKISNSEAPPRVVADDKCAQTFFGTVARGVRVIREELPLTVRYDGGNGETSAWHELAFYDCVCFDTPDSCIVLGFVLDDLELDELFTNEEVLSLSRTIFAQGVPLYEAFIFRTACAERDEELNMVSRLVRSGAMGDFPSGEHAVPRGGRTPFSENITQDFFEYAVGQWRRSWNEINHALDASGSDLLPAMERQDAMLRNLSNIAALLHPHVKPQIDVLMVSEFVNTLREVALNCAHAANVTLQVEDRAPDEPVAVDAAALVKLCEKIMWHHYGAYGATSAVLSAEMADGPEAMDFVALRISDDGHANSEESTPSNLAAIDGGQKMRLGNGGGILYLLGVLLLQKGGGRFRLRPVETGYCAELLLPRAKK
ncbi:hypothetical protein IT570_06540 [Candidatus Sumerlaeota bacterium]|nr:hypothetical protein [Candidatus Sumerlaeota bacterium]